MKVTFTVNTSLFSPGTLGKLQSIIFVWLEYIQILVGSVIQTQIGESFVVVKCFYFQFTATCMYKYNENTLISYLWHVSRVWHGLLTELILNQFHHSVRAKMTVVLPTSNEILAQFFSSSV